jgi:hypothetical protein
MNSAGNPAERVSTGLQGLDEILDSLRIGDNVVWRIDSIADYRSFVTPFVRTSLQEGKRVVYMRFGRHEPLVQPAPNASNPSPPASTPSSPKRDAAPSTSSTASPTCFRRGQPT